MSSKHRPSIHPCGKTAAPLLHHSHQLFLRPARSARPWRLELRSSRQTSSCATVYEEWLDRVAELVRAAGGSPAPSVPLHRTPPRAGDEAPAAPRPPPPQEGAMAPRRVAPGRNPLRQVPARQEKSCQEVPRPQEAARALPAPASRDHAPAPAREDPTLLPAAAHGDQALRHPRPPVATAGCRAYTTELRSIVWPGKFKPDLLPQIGRAHV